MKRIITTLIAGALAMCAPPAFAAEGDFVQEYGNAEGEYIVREYLLCDGDKSDGTPPNSCATQDLTTIADPAVSTRKAYGLPEFIVADITADNCDTTENLGFLIGLTASGGERHQLHGVGMQLGSNVSSVTVHPLAHRFVSFDVTTEGSGGSCNDFEVTLRLFYVRSHLLGQR